MTMTVIQAALRQSPRIAYSPWLILQTRSSRRSFRRRTYATRIRNPYPFPNATEPTPYQIFHLMPDASPADVKQRYYELVRLYHPDSAESRQREPDASRRHAQFSAITRAYSRLQKRSGGDLGLDADVAEGVVNPWARAPSMHQRRYDEPQFVDDRWKDRLLLGVMGLSFVGVAAQTVVVRRRRFQDVAESIRANEPVEVPVRWNLPSTTNSGEEESLKLRRPRQS